MSYDLRIEGRQGAPVLDEAAAEAAIAGVEVPEGVGVDVEDDHILVTLPLPLLDEHGRRVTELALAIAKRIDGRVFDVQRDRFIDDGDLAATLAAHAQWKRTAQHAIARALAERLPTTGFRQEEDGWWTADEGAADRALILGSAPPRPYGVLQQLARDFRSPLAGAGWIAALASVVFGAVTERWWLFAFAAFWAWQIVPTLVGLARVIRDGTVQTVVVREVSKIPVVKDQVAASFEFSTGGVPRKSRVLIPKALALKLLIEDRGIELKVLVNDRAPAHSQLIALRVAPAAVPV